MTKIDLLESMFQGLIAAGLRPSKILIAFHNACVHGESLEKAGWNVTDETLGAAFAGFDTSIAALKAMEE